MVTFREDHQCGSISLLCPAAMSRSLRVGSDGEAPYTHIGWVIMPDAYSRSRPLPPWPHEIPKEEQLALATDSGNRLLVARPTGNEQVAPECRVIVPAHPKSLGAAGGDGPDLRSGWPLARSWQTSLWRQQRPREQLDGRIEALQAPGH